MSKRCDCADWATNIPKVNAPFAVTVLTVLSGIRPYDGKTFTHCPWCGTPLRDQDLTFMEGLGDLDPKANLSAR